MPGPSTQSIPANGARLAARFCERGGTISRCDYARPSGRVAAWRLTPPGALTGRVVFAHATGNDAFYPHATLLEAALESRFEVFVFDLDGHGVESDTSLSRAGARGMIAEALAAAARNVPAVSTHLVGQSLSAACALAEAADGLPIESLTMISLPHRLALSPWSAVSELATLMRPCFWTLAKAYGLGGLMPAMGPLGRTRFPVRLADARRQAWRYPGEVAALIHALDLDAAVKRLKIPALLIHGACDAIAPLDQAVALATRMPAGQIAVLAGATHFSTPLERGAHDALRTWLRKQCADK